MHQIIHCVRQIAAADLTTVRDLLTGATRAATDAELLNFGLKRIGPDLFDCAEDYRSVVFEDEQGNPVHAWYHVSEPAPTSDNGVRHAAFAAQNRLGTLHSIGRAGERHRAVPDSVKPHVLRARVIAAAAPHNAVTLATAAAGTNPDPDQVLAAAQQLLAAQTTAAPAPTASPATPSAPPALQVQLIPMAAVDPTAHVIVEENLHPHSWHGERVVPPPATIS